MAARLRFLQPARSQDSCQLCSQYCQPNCAEFQSRTAGWADGHQRSLRAAAATYRKPKSLEAANMNNLDNIGQTFQWAGQRYMAIMQPFAEKIFLGLVLIEIIITCVHFLTDQDEPTRLLAELVKKSLALGFLYAMIVNAPIWFSAIIQGFQQIGGQAAGIPGLSPSSAFNSGLALFQIIYRGFGSLGWFHVTMAALIALIAGLIMFLSFALIAGQMLLALCEAYMGVGGGVLLLGFSGSRWTIKFAEGFLGWIVGVGIKVFFLYLMVGIGLTITAGWNTALTRLDIRRPIPSPDNRRRSADLRASRLDDPKHSRIDRWRCGFAQFEPRLRSRDGWLRLRPNSDEPERRGAESGAPSQGGHSLGASLEAGDRAATNNGARSASTHPTVQMPSSVASCFA